jgi:hypothetical protein
MERRRWEVETMVVQVQIVTIYSPQDIAARDALRVALRKEGKHTRPNEARRAVQGRGFTLDPVADVGRAKSHQHGNNIERLC